MKFENEKIFFHKKWFLFSMESFFNWVFDTFVLAAVVYFNPFVVALRMSTAETVAKADLNCDLESVRISSTMSIFIFKS